MGRSDQGELVFLKLGGSLITDKTQPESARITVIRRLARELAEALRSRPSLRLVLGHGSGSFGHVAGERFGIRHGVTDEEGWWGFALTAAAAQRLNRLVSDIMLSEGVAAWTLQPSASASCNDGQLVYMDHHPISRALEMGLVPLVYGDVALDEVRGGTIVSTEEVFAWLALRLKPSRIVLAGDVQGVQGVTSNQAMGAGTIAEITPQTLPDVMSLLGGSHGTDVTGGMLGKVQTMCALVEKLPELQVRIISGQTAGLVGNVLVDGSLDVGTAIRAHSFQMSHR